MNSFKHSLNQIISLNQTAFSEFLENTNKLQNLLQPIEYLFNTIIPLHFTQDLLLLDSLKLKGFSPYMDIDIVDFHTKSPFIISNLYKTRYAKKGHLKRLFGPRFSSKLITILDQDCAKIGNGKGFSPKNMAFSPFYSGLKYLAYKIREGNSLNIPNFPYNNWYREFLIQYFTNNNFDVLDIKKKNILESIKNVNTCDEKGFLPFTKLINLNMTHQLL